VKHHRQTNNRQTRCANLDRRPQTADRRPQTADRAPENHLAEALLESQTRRQDTFRANICAQRGLAQRSINVRERIAQASPAAALTEANGWVVNAMTLGVGAGTFLAGPIVGASGTSAVSWIVLGASAVTVMLSLVDVSRRSLISR